MLPVIGTLTDLLKKGVGITTMEFHEAVIDAVKDGKLTKEEIDRLETLREELGLPLEVLRAIRVQAYVRAFETVKNDTEITEDEWDELEQIQDYLGVKDTEIAKTKKELYRLRVMSEIKKGNMPLLVAPHLILKPNEIAYWSEKVLLVDESDKQTDSGELILTNKRIVFQGQKETIATTLGRILDMSCSVKGVTIRINRQKPLHFRYSVIGNHDIVGSVLFSMMENAGENA